MMMGHIRDRENRRLGRAFETQHATAVQAVLGLVPRSNLRKRLAQALAIVLMSIAPASAMAADFYQGKTVSLLINFTAGGPTDVEGRLAARHLARHVAGNPQVVVRNMAGAGGVIGANWLGEVSPTDGLTVGFFTGVASKSAIGEAALRIDVASLAFIAAGPGVSVTYVRTDVAPGLKTPSDILKASGFWAAGLSPDADKDIRLRLQLDMLGLRYNYISHYPGSAEARLALERNEVQMYVESMPTYRSQIEPNLVAAGRAIPLWHDPMDTGTAFVPAAESASIPAKTYTEFLREMKGGFPTGPIWDAYRLANAVGSDFLRIVVMRPGSPPEAVAAMRKAFAGLADDPDYIADAMRTVKYVPRYLSDEPMQRRYLEKLKPDPALRDFLRAYVEAGRNAAAKR